MEEEIEIQNVPKSTDYANLILIAVKADGQAYSVELSGILDLVNSAASSASSNANLIQDFTNNLNTITRQISSIQTSADLAVSAANAAVLQANTAVSTADNALEVANNAINGVCNVPGETEDK